MVTGLDCNGFSKLKAAVFARPALVSTFDPGLPVTADSMPRSSSFMGMGSNLWSWQRAHPTVSPRKAALEVESMSSMSS